MDWESAANFLKGIYITLTRQSIISHLPHLKVTYRIQSQDVFDIHVQSNLSIKVTQRKQKYWPL